MLIEVTNSAFHDLMKDEGFSYYGLNALYDYLEENHSGLHFDLVELRDFQEIEAEELDKETMEVVATVPQGGYIIRYL